MLRATVVLLAIASIVAAVAATAADKAPTRPQSLCPVTGKPIDAKTSPHVDWQGQRIYFTDKAAADAFRRDPEKAFAAVAAAGVALQNIQTTCPVSGEKLGGGDMGDPVSIGYKGRTVRFCCGGCTPKFDKEPAKYLAKLPGEQPKAD